MSGARGIPDATVARLPVYHRVLAGLAEAGTATVSSDELAAACGMEPATLKATVDRFNTFARAGKDDDFGRGERFVREPIPRGEFEEIVAQAERWGLDDFMKEKRFEKLVFAAG